VTLATRGLPRNVIGLLTQVQHDLFDLGGELCIPGLRIIGDGHVVRWSANSTPSTQSSRHSRISSAGRRPAGAACHLARTITAVRARAAVRWRATKPWR